MCGRTAVPVRRAVFSSSSMSAGEGHSASFFSFAPSCLLLALSCPYHPVVSYRLRSVEALRGGRRGVGRYASAGRRRDFGFSSLVPSSRLALVSRQAVRVLSFRPGVSSRRLVGRVVSSLSCSLLFSDHSFAASHGHGNGRRLVICGLVSLVSLRRATSWNPIG